MPSGWNPGAGMAAITPSLAYRKYGSPNNAWGRPVLPSVRPPRERSSRKGQDVAAQAHWRGMLMPARRAVSDNRPMSAELTAHRRKTRAAALSVGSNAALIVLKLVAAGVTGSIALLTDAVHSSIDLLASFIALFAIRKADQPADESHPYGHEKAE